MNKESSRSHCLFTISCTSTEKVEGGTMERHGKLYMVDLAGSECAKTAGTAGNSVSMAESKNINKSLLTLGRVITALREKQSKSSARIPYRDSKLTRLLEEALGGRCKTCIIATLSPSASSVEATLSTLSYAQRAHGIQNKVTSASARMSICAQRQDGTGLGGAGGGGGSEEGSTMSFREMELKMGYYESQAAEATSALARKHNQAEEATRRADDAEAKADGMVEELDEAKTRAEELGEEVVVCKAEVVRSGHLLDARVVTEEALTGEAQALVQAVDASVAQAGEVYAARVQDAATVDAQRGEGRTFRGAVGAKLAAASTAMGAFCGENVAATCADLKSVSTALATDAKANVSTMLEATASMEQQVSATALEIGKTGSLKIEEAVATSDAALVAAETADAAALGALGTAAENTTAAVGEASSSVGRLGAQLGEWGASAATTQGEFGARMEESKTATLATLGGLGTRAAADHAAQMEAHGAQASALASHLGALTAQREAAERRVAELKSAEDEAAATMAARVAAIQKIEDDLSSTRATHTETSEAKDAGLAALLGEAHAAASAGAGAVGETITAFEASSKTHMASLRELTVSSSAGARGLLDAAAGAGASRHAEGMDASATHTAALLAIEAQIGAENLGAAHAASLGSARDASVTAAGAQEAAHAAQRTSLASLKAQVTTSQDAAQETMGSLWSNTENAVDEGAAAATTLLSEQERHMQEAVKEAQAGAREALLRETLSEMESILRSKLDGLASSLDTAVAAQMEKSASIRGGVEATRAAVTSFRGEAGVAQATWVEAVGATTAEVENIDVATASTMESAAGAQQAMEGIIAGLEGESATWSDSNVASAGAVAAAVAENNAMGERGAASHAAAEAETVSITTAVVAWEQGATSGLGAMETATEEASAAAREALQGAQAAIDAKVGEAEAEGKAWAEGAQECGAAMGAVIAEGATLHQTMVDHRASAAARSAAGVGNGVALSGLVAASIEATETMQGAATSMAEATGEGFAAVQAAGAEAAQGAEAWAVKILEAIAADRQAREVLVAGQGEENARALSECDRTVGMVADLVRSMTESMGASGAARRTSADATHTVLRDTAAAQAASCEAMGEATAEAAALVVKSGEAAVEHLKVAIDDNLITGIDKLEADTEAARASQATMLEDVEVSVGGFCVDILHVDEPSPVVAPLDEIPCNKELSSTPADDVVLAAAENCDAAAAIAGEAEEAEEAEEVEVEDKGEIAALAQIQVDMDEEGAVQKKSSPKKREFSQAIGEENSAPTPTRARRASTTAMTRSSSSSSSSSSAASSSKDAVSSAVKRRASAAASTGIPGAKKVRQPSNKSGIPRAGSRPR